MGEPWFAISDVRVIMARTGRPRKEIDKTDFEGLLELQCTLEEVTAFFDHKLNGCSADTIERWCKREYGETFADVSAKKRNLGKISIRRMQFALAKKSAPLLIFLGKQYLGQSDNPVQEGMQGELLKGLQIFLRGEE